MEDVVKRIMELVKQINESYQEIDTLLEDVSMSNAVSVKDQWKFDEFYRNFDTYVLEDILDACNEIEFKNEEEEM